MHCLALILEAIHSKFQEEIRIFFRQFEEDEDWTLLGEFSEDGMVFEICSYNFALFQIYL